MNELFFKKDTELAVPIVAIPIPEPRHRFHDIAIFDLPESYDPGVFMRMTIYGRKALVPIEAMPENSIS